MHSYQDDQNNAKKEFEKINNYTEPSVEIARVWNMETEVVPVSGLKCMS